MDIITIHLVFPNMCERREDFWKFGVFCIYGVVGVQRYEFYNLDSSYYGDASHQYNNNQPSNFQEVVENVKLLT